MNGGDGDPLDTPREIRFNDGTDPEPEFTHEPPAFTFYPLPSVTRIWPDLTLAAGGTLVTLHGEGFASFGDLSTTKCRFGVVEVHAQYKRADQIICVAPAEGIALPYEDDAVFEVERMGGGEYGGRGLAEVWLTLNDQDYQRVGEVRYFRFEVDEVSPSGGPSGGGTLVTLHGRGFDGFESPSAPEDAPTAALDLRTRSAMERTMRCRFRFRVPEGSEPRPSGTGAAGYISGGVDGLGAPWPAQWAIEVPVISRDNHALRCVTPQAPTNFTGRVDVELTMNDLNYYPDFETSTPERWAARPHFTYYALKLYSISPAGGPAQGGTAITLHGEHLNDYGTLEQTFCRFGDGRDGMPTVINGSSYTRRQRAGPHRSCELS